ncbi:MAG: hypothetical protein JO072_00865 [Parafilimonas sp.]|nr:hypothetical protein [Parafilimonas sp.]
MQHFQIKPIVLISLLLTITAACKKEINNYSKINAGNVSDYATNNVIAVQSGILKPATPSQFIANGNTSTAVFQISSTKHIWIDQMNFEVTYPAVQSINNYIVWPGGYYWFNPGIEIQQNGNANYNAVIQYNPVDSSTSGTIAQIKLHTVEYYDTYNNQYYFDFNPDSTANVSFPMCLVNNIPHIKFTDPPHFNPSSDTAWVEISEVKLTGDSAWTLNKLPIFEHMYAGVAPAKLMAKYQGTKVANDTKQPGVLKFSHPFQHKAGETETLKIFGYKPFVYMGGSLVISIGDLSNFEWKDGVGKLVSGSLNQQFFKSQTGTSYLTN